VIPRKLALRNFMCYREDVPPLEFDGISIACLSGENGAGKSTLLDALTWSLWGEARLKSDDDLIALGATEMEVDLTFALDGQEYRVIRKRSKGKRVGQTWLDFQVRNGDGWKSLSGAGVRETQEAIIRTLRMGYETFANSAFLRQGHADEFTRKKPAERKAVLAEILGLDVYEQLEERAKERARGLDGQIRGLEGRIEAYRHEAEQHEMRAGLVAAAERRAAALEAACQEAEQALAAAQAQAQALEALKPQRDALCARLEQLRARRDRLVGEIEVRRRDLLAAEATVARRAEIAAGLAALQAARQELERLEALRVSYDALVERRRAHAEALRAAEAQLRGDLRLAEAELEHLRARAARRPTLEQEIAALTTRLEAFATANQELAAARDRRAALGEQLSMLHSLQLEQANLQKRIEMKHNSLVATREEWKRTIKEAGEHLKDADRWQAERDRAATERAHLERESAALEQKRAVERELVEQAGALRAERESIKTRGDEINKKLAMLGEDTTHCPLCNHELGRDGVAHVAAEYERERQDLRARYTALGREIQTIEARLRAVRAEIQAAEQRVATLPEIAARLARLDRDLRTAEEMRQKQATIQRELSMLELQILKGDYEREARVDLARVESALAAIGDRQGMEREGKRLDERIRKLEQQLEEQASLRAQIETSRRELAAIDDEAATLREEERRAAELRRTLDAGDFAHDERAALAAAEAEIAACGYSPEQHRAARDEARALAGWDEESRQLARAEERLARDTALQARDEAELARMDGELAEANEALAALDVQLRALGPALAARERAEAELRERRRELAVADRDLGEKQALLRRAAEAAEALRAAEEQRAGLLHRKGLFDELTVAFGKKGVQALLIETAIPEIEQEANRLLGHMTDNQLHLTFETQRDTKKGDISETLEIKIADALGTRDYDAYSGGESFRVDFAIRIALAKLLARRAGARLETLVIDEGFGSQDAKGRERLVEAITSIQSDFKQILVVTHIQELKDMFPAFIEITKTPQGSTWALG
jgi:exonuclease SbcC